MSQQAMSTNQHIVGKSVLVIALLSYQALILLWYNDQIQQTALDIATNVAESVQHSMSQRLNKFVDEQRLEASKESSSHLLNMNPAEFTDVYVYMVEPELPATINCDALVRGGDKRMVALAKHWTYQSPYDQTFWSRLAEQPCARIVKFLNFTVQAQADDESLPIGLSMLAHQHLEQIVRTIKAMFTPWNLYFTEM